jgi:hypothetical protein
MLRSLLFITLLLIFSNCSKDTTHPISSVSGKWIYDYDSASWETGKIYSPDINFWNFQSTGVLEFLNEPGDLVLDSFQYNQTSTSQMILTHIGHTGNTIIYTYDTVHILILNSRNLYISYPQTYVDTSFNKQTGEVFFTLSRN